MRLLFFNFYAIISGVEIKNMSSDIIILAVLIVFSAIFSGSETALVSLTKSKVNELADKKAANSKILKKLKSDPHKLLITILIGNNVVNIAASAYAALIFTEAFGNSGVGIATGVMTFFILVFGEITPKSFCHQHSIGVSQVMARPIYYLQLLLFPVVWILEKITGIVNMIFGRKNNITVTEGELLAMIKIGTKEGSIEKHEQELIENVLEFNDIRVEEVMTPRVAVEALDSSTTIAEAVKFVIKHSHSRIPIYEGSMDRVSGILSLKDLLHHWDKHDGRKKLKNLKLPMPLEIPTTKKINKLFRDFQRKHVHFAIVIDEFGGTAGIVTMEDLLEEIVGEIVDEYDVAEKPIEIINKNSIYAKGSTLLEDINDYFRLKIADNDRDTLNTLILETISRFPREGEVVKLPYVKIKVLKMNKNVVGKVKITKTPQRDRR